MHIESWVCSFSRTFLEFIEANNKKNHPRWKKEAELITSEVYSPLCNYFNFYLLENRIFQELMGMPTAL
jgi:hypothetical protein